MHVEFIRDKSRQMSQIRDPHLVHSMKVWHCNFKTLQPISARTNLKTLIIGTFPDDSFRILSSLNQLEHLEVLHLPKVTQLDHLTKLQELSTLRLATLPSWDASGKVTTIDSLDPLTRLPNLKHLELFGIRPSDKSLAPLEQCPQLVSVRVSKYPTERGDSVL